MINYRHENSDTYHDHITLFLVAATLKAAEFLYLFTKPPEGGFVVYQTPFRRKKPKRNSHG
jgi:hypothetical protein